MWFDESSAILASYCNGYTDREEFENEKRRKKWHSSFSPYSPTRRP